MVAIAFLVAGQRLSICRSFRLKILEVVCYVVRKGHDMLKLHGFVCLITFFQ